MVSAMVAAFLAVAVVLTVRSGGRGDSRGVTPTPTTAADTDLVPVAADLVRRTGGAAETAADELVIERRNGSALLSFPSADVDVACVQRAQLVVTQLSGHGRINVWVSLETEAATLPDGTALGTTVIAHESPWVSAPSAPPGGHATWTC